MASRTPAAFLACLLSAAVLVSLPVGGQSQPPVQTPLSERGAVPTEAPPVLGLDDLLRMSLDQNPALRQAGLDIGAAEGRALQAGLKPNPRVEVNGEEIGRLGGFHTIEVSQEIVTANKLGLSRAVGLKEVDQATLTLMLRRTELLTTVRQGYFEILALQRRVEALGELVGLASQAYENARKVLGAGEAAKPESLQFQIELDRLKTDLDAARRDRAAAWRRLTAAMGVSNLPLTTLAGSLEAPPPDIDFEQARAAMLELHPDARLAQVGIARAQLVLKRAEAETVPNVTVAGGYTYSVIDHENQGTYHVSLPIPFYNRNQGNILAAQQEVNRALQEIARVQNDLDGRLGAAVEQYAAARERAERYRTSILPAARESYRLTLLAFQGGQSDYLRVLQSQRAIGDANLTYIQALADQWRAGSEIAGLLLQDGWPFSNALGPCAALPGRPEGAGNIPTPLPAERGKNR